MNFKVIETDSEFPDVLIFRDVDDEGKNCVTLQCYDSEDTDYHEVVQYEIIDFPNVDLSKSFINDFSVESANKWCKDNGYSY